MARAVAAQQRCRLFLNLTTPEADPLLQTRLLEVMQQKLA